MRTTAARYIDATEETTAKLAKTVKFNREVRRILIEKCAGT
jgi:hypothetical protein